MVLGVVSSLCVDSFAIYGFEAHFVGNIEEISGLMPTRPSQHWVKWANLALNYFQGPKKQMSLTKQIWLNWTFFGGNLALFPKEVFPNADPIQLQQFIDFWDQHVSTWHPQLATPPAAVYPSACLLNTLDDTKLELAEMLNRLQRHTKCTAGYCEWKKKGSGEIFCQFGFPKECCETSAYTKNADQNLFLNFTLAGMMSF
jgi:hypothetical protein